jgi:hypothetical protein
MKMKDYLQAAAGTENNRTKEISSVRRVGDGPRALMGRFVDR